MCREPLGHINQRNGDSLKAICLTALFTLKVDVLISDAVTVTAVA